jgi:hypothetical protein
MMHTLNQLGRKVNVAVVTSGNAVTSYQNGRYNARWAVGALSC